MKLKLTKSLVVSVCTSVGLLGASAGVVFGVSAGMYKVNYMDLDTIQTRINSAMNQGCYSQNISSQWNMNANLNPNQQDITLAKWKDLHGESVPLPSYSKTGKAIEWKQGDEETLAENRWNFATMSIDGSTHATLDRSFNQSLYNGIINFIQGKEINTSLLQSDTTIMPKPVLGNYTAASFKPSEDNNNGLTSTYKAIASTSTPFRILGLAGFNHVSPLGDLGTVDESGRFVFGQQFKDLANMLMLLIDGSVANNQAVSSVLFRADQPGFLTGIATCMYFYNNLQLYHKNFKDISVGLFGGNPIPTVTVYMGGFQRGIEFFNRFVLLKGLLTDDLQEVFSAQDPISELENNKIYKDLKNLIDYSKNKDEIYLFLKKEGKSKYLTPTDVAADLYPEYKVRQIQLGAFGTHFTGSFSSGDAIGITKQYLARGASAIVAIAGPQSLDVAQEIQNQGSECIVVGVDSAMENGQYQRKHTKGGLEDKSEAITQSASSTEEIKSYPAQKDNIIKFSAVKDITTVTKKFCELCINNQNFDVEKLDENGNGTGQPDPLKSVCGVGYLTCGNILNGLISISFDGWHPFVQAMTHVANEKSGLSFEYLWSEAAVKYFDKLPAGTVPDAVQATLHSIAKIDTYDPNLQIGDTKEDTIEKYYQHVTGILGTMLESIKLNFEGMCVKPTLDSTGKVIKVEEVTGEAAKMTILDWLTNNMYFSC